MKNPKGCLKLELIYSLRLNKGKGVGGFWVREASYGEVMRKTMVNKGSIMVYYADQSDFFSIDKLLRVLLLLLWEQRTSLQIKFSL